MEKKRKPDKAAISDTEQSLAQPYDYYSTENVVKTCQYLSAKQVEQLKALIKRHPPSERVFSLKESKAPQPLKNEIERGITNQFLLMANAELEDRSDLETKKKKKSLIGGTDWKHLSKEIGRMRDNIKSLCKEVEFFICTNTEGSNYLENLPAKIQATKYLEDQLAVHQPHTLGKKITFALAFMQQFLDVDFAGYLSSNPRDIKESLEVAQVIHELQSLKEPLTVAGQALETAEEIMQIADKRKRGNPGNDEQSLRLMGAFVNMCMMLLEIRPTHEPKSEFIGFLQRYIDILGIELKAEGLASNHKYLWANKTG